MLAVRKRPLLGLDIFENAGNEFPYAGGTARDGSGSLRFVPSFFFAHSTNPENSKPKT
jgi:hypothetical protein